MKNIKFLIGIMFLSILSACTDFVEPAIPYNNFETGTYLRTIKAPASINYFNLANEKFAVEVEAHAIDNQNNVKEVEIFVKHRRANTLSNEVKLGSVPGSSFAVSGDSKRPRAVITASLTETMAKLGKTPATINGGDFFEYRLALTTNDGKVFSSNNLSADVSGGAYYASPFLYRVAVVCPSTLAGTYDYETVDIKAAGKAACGTGVKGTVTLKATASVGAYEVSDSSFGVFACAYDDAPPGGAVRFNDACGKVTMSGTDRYGDAYSITEVVGVSGNRLTFKWKNTYGDSGTTTLIKKDGNWPSTMR